MHILYLHQYFATPNGKTGTRSYEFAKRWVACGHRVTMLTSTAHLTEADIGDKRRGLVTRVKIDGIDVIALGVDYRQTMGFARRAWAFVWFMLLATCFVLVIRGVSIVYATSTPLTVGVPAILGRWIRRRRFVFEVRDPWPAVPVEMGLIRNALLIGLLRWLERLIYRNAEGIVTASPGMTELVRRVADAGSRVITVPNCADTDLFTPEVDGSRVRRELGWDRRVVYLHAGAMGRVNGLDCIVRAADHFRNDAEFLFVLLGEGREKQELMAQRDRLKLTNLQILDGVAKSKLPPVLAAADVCLMTITFVPLLEHNSANKFFDYLSAGRPVILNYGGWQRDVLESAGAGMGCTMGDEKSFFDNLAALKADQPGRLAMGGNARKLAVERYSRDLLAATALEFVAEAERAPRRHRRLRGK